MNLIQSQVLNHNFPFYSDWALIFLLRLTDDPIPKCTSMTLRWTLWPTLTSSLADRAVVSLSQMTVISKDTLCPSCICIVTPSCSYFLSFQAKVSSEWIQWPLSCISVLGWRWTSSLCLWDGAKRLWEISKWLYRFGK